MKLNYRIHRSNTKQTLHFKDYEYIQKRRGFTTMGKDKR